MFDEELCAAIRAVLGLDESVAPDSLIGSPLIGGQAERDVLAEVGPPPFLERPIGEQEAIRMAVAYRTAAALLGTGAVREYLTTTSERFSDQYTVQRDAPDLDGWARSLRHQARRALEGLVPQTGTAGLFTLAPGRRGA